MQSLVLLPKRHTSWMSGSDGVKWLSTVFCYGILEDLRSWASKQSGFSVCQYCAVVLSCWCGHGLLSALDQRKRWVQASSVHWVSCALDLRYQGYSPTSAHCCSSFLFPGSHQVAKQDKQGLLCGLSILPVPVKIISGTLCARSLTLCALALQNRFC